MVLCDAMVLWCEFSPKNTDTCATRIAFFWFFHQCKEHHLPAQKEQEQWN
jgi:hypothetical protein